MHVHLRVGKSRDGKPAFEPIHAHPLGGRRYRVLFTPGLAYGIAADDEIELADDGTYAVVSRGKNIAVRVFSDEPLQDLEASLTIQVQVHLSGRLDGRRPHGLAYTVPLSAGFGPLEDVFTIFTQAHAGTLWEYGNVYGEDGLPLNWWNSAA